jgi:hypothetical protein
VTLGPGKYAATISLPNGYKLAGTDGAYSARMTKDGVVNAALMSKRCDGKYDNHNNCYYTITYSDLYKDD